MRPLRTAVLLAFALVALTATASASTRSEASARRAAAQKTTGYVVLNSWDAGLIPGIRKRWPRVKVLAYNNLTLTVQSACNGGVDDSEIGAGYCDAVEHHAHWFLTTRAGKRINSAWFPRAWMMDVGSPSYQQHWLSTVLTQLRRGDWDGVLVDDADADPNWHLNGRVIGKYPTIKSWQTATRSMLARVGPRLTSKGYLFIPNLQTPWSASYNALSVWKDWLRFGSGASQEYYSKWGDASSQWFVGSDWTFRQSFQTATEKAGKIFIGITYSPRSDSRSKLYAESNFLLNTTGGPSSLLLKTSREMGDPTMRSWTSPIGRPIAARKQVGGAWRRAFSGGAVAVNPTKATRTVKLGKRYRNARGKVVSSVRLRPANGAIFTSVR